MKRKANISFVLLVSLLVICSGSAILSIAVSSKYDSKFEYERLRNRYIAESGVDTAVGLFMNYLENQDYTLTYTKNEDGSYSVITQYSPFLLNEIKESTAIDNVSIDLVANESRDYLSSVGFLDFTHSGKVEISVNTFSDKERFKLCEMCTEPDFLLSGDSGQKRSKLQPIYLTVKSQYAGGEVMCSIKIGNIYAVRNEFINVEVGELGNVSAYLDIGTASIEHENFQNYRRQS